MWRGWSWELQAPPSWARLPRLHVGQAPCPFPRSCSGEHMDGRARPTAWEGNRDLPIVPDAWLLPFPAVERAGSSKITKTGNCWELGLAKGLMEPATRQVWKWHRIKGCRKQCSVTSGQPCVLWAALHPHLPFSPYQSDALERCLVHLPLQPTLEVELKSQAVDARWKQTGKVFVMYFQLPGVFQVPLPMI